MSFHQSLIQYINNGGFSKIDYLQSIINDSIPFRKHSGRLGELYSRFLQNEEGLPIQKSEISVAAYEGSNSFVLKMMKGLERELADDLVGAYLQGSLASNEEIAYSDFDALVVLKNSVFEEDKRLERVALGLYRMQKIMHDFDPLQHHGWFVLTEGMLKNYPIAYFPLVLFKHSVSLLQTKGLNLSISYAIADKKLVAPFIRLCDSLLGKLSVNYKVNNSFYLKSFLSEFMLLPSLYLQAKTGNSVYKKDSFELARIDFDEKDWEIMDEVSLIRENWEYEISSFQKIMLCNEKFIVRKLSRKLAPSISKKISSKLTIDFYKSMSSLVLLMKAKIKSA